MINFRPTIELRLDTRGLEARARLLDKAEAKFGAYVVFEWLRDPARVEILNAIAAIEAEAK